VNDDPERGSMSVSPQSLKFLLGGVGILQGLLTGLGVSNGGLDAMVINHRFSLISGLALVLVGTAIGGFLLVIKPNEQVPRALVLAGSAFVLVGITITAYTALIAPAIAKAPDIDVAVSDAAGQLTLTAHVKVGGIKESDHYWVEVDARTYVSTGGGSYLQLGPPLYQAQLGADSQGNIDSTVSVPLLPGQYPAASIEAWYGKHAGPCGLLAVTAGASAKNAATREAKLQQNGRPGCVVVRLPRGPDPAASAKTKPHRSPHHAKRRKPRPGPKHSSTTRQTTS
jgi:hypothetical protein